VGITKPPPIKNIIETMPLALFSAGEHRLGKAQFIGPIANANQEKTLIQIGKRSIKHPQPKIGERPRLVRSDSFCFIHIAPN
jgi:hypothetical protein